MGDYEEGSLALAMQDKKLVGDAVAHYLELAHLHPLFQKTRQISGKRTSIAYQRISGQCTQGERRKAFVFAVNINHSMMLADAFEKAGVRVAHLDGKTPNDHRKSMLRDLDSGKLEVVCNCNILLEGVDIPSVKMCVHCRPTLSLVLWMQSTARIFRPWNGRGPVTLENPSIVPMLLDHAGNLERHGAPFEDRQWSLSHAPRRMSSTIPMKMCKKCYAYCAPSCAICPHCGSESPKNERKPPQHTAEHLVMRNAEPEDMKRAYFQKMAVLARSRGFKPGFASAKFLEEYGNWPPRAWSDGLKGVFQAMRRGNGCSRRGKSGKRKKQQRRSGKRMGGMGWRVWRRPRLLTMCRPRRGNGAVARRGTCSGSRCDDGAVGVLRRYSVCRSVGRIYAM